MIKWQRSFDHRIQSKDGRWIVVPIWPSQHGPSNSLRPLGYFLLKDGLEVAGGLGYKQWELKETAKRLARGCPPAV